jgi:hypothetical protein
MFVMNQAPRIVKAQMCICFWYVNGAGGHVGGDATHTNDFNYGYDFQKSTNMFDQLVRNNACNRANQTRKPMQMIMHGLDKM